MIGELFFGFLGIAGAIGALYGLVTQQDPLSIQSCGLVAIGSFVGFGLLMGNK